MGSAVSRRRRPSTGRSSTSHHRSSSPVAAEEENKSNTDIPAPDIQSSNAAASDNSGTSEPVVVVSNNNGNGGEAGSTSTTSGDAAAASTNMHSSTVDVAATAVTPEPVLSSSSSRRRDAPISSAVTSSIQAVVSDHSYQSGDDDDDDTSTSYYSDDNGSSDQEPSNAGSTSYKFLRPTQPPPPPPPALAHQDNDTTKEDFVAGDLIIVGGRSVRKGKVGTFVKRTPKRVAVKIDGMDKLVYLHPDNIQHIGCTGGGTYHQSRYPNPEEKEEEAPTASAISAQLILTQQENRMPNISNTAERPPQPSGTATGRAPKTADGGDKRATESAEHEWFIPGGDDPMLHSSLGLPENYRQLIAPGGNAELHSTSAYHIFGNRLVMRKVNVTKELKDFPSRYREHDGRTYELLSSKLHRHQICTGHNSRFSRMQLTVVYVLIEGPDVQPINLQEELEKIAAFGRLEPRKVAARLELFLSTAQRSNRKGRDYLIFDHLRSDDFELIQESANEGCGYIPRSYIEDFLGNHAVGKRTFAIQVRIISTRLGIFKGVLMEKPGIDKIQLPGSMMKVGRSETSDAADKVCLIINGNGAFPCRSHCLLQKTLQGGSFPESERKGKKLSKMILSLLETLGVPHAVLSQYAEESRDKSGRFLKHSCLVGLADPSNFLPAGHVFITGASDTSEIGDHIFVSRFPCTENTDGFALPVVRSKPSSMPDEMWTWMKGLHFGGIMFGHPLPSQAPLPTLIANGDLDGDLYFVTWSKDLLSYIPRIQPLAYDLDEPSESDAKDSVPAWNENWLSEGQAVMGSVESLIDHSKLISKLHSVWVDFKEKYGCEHSDVLSLGRAYKNAIDIGKHGGKVSLPQHLWGELPLQLEQYLSCD